MFQRVNILIIFFLTFIFHNYSFADEKILFVDIEYIYSNSAVGKKIISQIQKDSKNINSEFNNYKKEIKINKEKLVNQKKILAKEEFDKKYVKLENDIKEFNNKINKKNNDLKIYKNKAKVEFLKKLNIILQKYANDNSIEMIINKKNILIGKNNLDATKDVLELFDKEIKTIKIN